MKSGFVDICGIPTNILTWGGWITEPLDPSVKEIAICITGNPGVAGFYTEWGKGLHQQLGGTMPLWIIGHAGHDDPAKSDVPQLNGNESAYNLHGQIEHKREFIDTYVPSHVKVHLLGHSIGAWMILQLLHEPEIKQKLKKCYLLFPTVERMQQSPNGWIFTNIAEPLYKTMGLFFWLMNRMPLAVQVFLIRVYFWFSAIPDVFIDATLRYTKSTVMEKVVFLARDEMDRVGKLDVDLIHGNQALLKFYYGTTDGWVPLKYYKQMRDQFPDLDAQLDTKKIDHAFVLRHSEQMAEIAGDMIAANRN